MALKPDCVSSIAFSPPSVDSVTFDFSSSAQAVAQGRMAVKFAGTPPTWTLQYNLEGNHNIQVCAYLSTQFTGGKTGVIPDAWLYGTPIGGAATPFTGNGCGLPNNAVTLDNLKSAAHSGRKTEGFTALSLKLPGGTVPAPGTYYGTLTVVAQVQ